MNVKTHPINPSLARLVFNRPFSAVVLATSLGVTSLLAYSSNSAKTVDPISTTAYAPSTYDLESLELTGPNAGKAIIKLDDLTVNVSFVLGSEPSSYGIPGSEYDEIYVNSLDVDSITNESGTEYRDFTSNNDHFNINQLIVSYIYKNKLVEAV